MTPRHLASVAATIIAGAALLSACGDDETGSSTPPPPAELSIVALESVGGPRWEPGDPACVEVGRDPDKTIAVLIAVKNFTLRPVGACGSLAQCGTAVVRLDPSADDQALKVEAAKTSLEVPFDAIALGSHTFRVELRDNRGEPVTDADAGGPLFGEVALEVKAEGECSGGADAGTDAANADASADADTDAAADADTDAAADADTDAAPDADADAAPEAGDDASADAADAAID